MPSCSPRTNSIDCGSRRCIIMASCPAPLGRCSTGRPSAATARSQRACHAASLGAALARTVSRRASVSPRRSAISCAAASTACASSSRAASVGARTSRLKRQRPGTTLMDPCGTSRIPTVATVPGRCCASRSTASVSSAAPAAASRRCPMGVVPAWQATPPYSPSHRRLPLMLVTTPSGRWARASTGPCSMCTST